MDAEDVKRIRKKFKFSQEVFANKVGVTTQTVSKWERGLFKPHATFQKRMKQLDERYVHPCKAMPAGCADTGE